VHQARLPPNIEGVDAPRRRENQPDLPRDFTASAAQEKKYLAEAVNEITSGSPGQNACKSTACDQSCHWKMTEQILKMI
jgi:hypothetical protein